MLAAGEGDAVLVKTPHGAATRVQISGVVHDPGLAPAWQEREGYGYISRETLSALGEPSALGELRVRFRSETSDVQEIERAATELGRWLADEGHPATSVRIPPPRRHPHQTQMMGVMFLLLAFSLMALVLSGILVATSMAAMLARQVREIGVMKTVGARAAQIAGMYASLVLGLGLLSVVWAAPVGTLGAQALARMSAGMLNLNLESQAVPAWVYGVQLLSGLLVPLLAASLPILRASRLTVRQAIDQHGASVPSGVGWIARLSAGSWLSRTTQLAIRNAFRRRGRLALTVLLLGVGGGMFMTALNLSESWNRIIDRVYENRSYDLELRLPAGAKVEDSLRAVEGVKIVEAWGYQPTALWRPERLDVVRTYPDGSHGSLAILGPPPETTLVHFPLLAGRWLSPEDTDAVVLNHMALAQASGTQVGDTVQLSAEGRPTSWRVVGIVEEVGSPGVAYVNRTAFEERVSRDLRLFRVSTTAKDPEERSAVIRRIESSLEKQSISVEAVIPLSVLRTAMGDHIIVLIRLLLAMAALMVVVGMLGLASTMGTNVLERSKEIGVLKTIGATPRQIVRLITTEAFLIAGLSFGASTLLSLPLSRWVGRTVGLLSFKVQLPLAVDPRGVAAWLLLVSLVAVIATLLPARRAARWTVWAAMGRL
jgi:putative ABC transport system permease protein